MTEEILEILQEDDLPEQFKIVVEFCGIDTAKKLISEFGGMPLYVPKLTSLKGLIKRFYNDKDVSHRRIARDLSISEASVKRIFKN